MPTLRSLRSLDWLNFLLADVQTGVGPFLSACVVTTQFTIALIAGQAGRLAGSWGRKPKLLIGFGVLPVRALLYTLTDKPAMLIAIQLLDGIGAGIFGVLSVLVIADLTRGTGRFNLSQGVIATAVGIGAALSQLAGGIIVHHVGYRAVFLFCAATAAAAFVILLLFMPETNPRGHDTAAGFAVSDPPSPPTAGLTLDSTGRCCSEGEEQPHGDGRRQQEGDGDAVEFAK